MEKNQCLWLYHSITLPTYAKWKERKSKKHERNGWHIFTMGCWCIMLKAWGKKSSTGAWVRGNIRALCCHKSAMATEGKHWLCCDRNSEKIACILVIAFALLLPA